MQEKEIMLSICITTYNHEKYIEECLSHVLSQKMNFSYEILVGDDCSNDDTVKCLKKYEDRITIFRRDFNIGLCANMFELFVHAKGKYIFDLSGDDYLCDDYALQKLVNFLEEHDEYYSVSFWNYIYWQETGSMEKPDRDDFPLEYTIYDFLKNGQVCCMEGLIKNTFKEDFDKIGYLKNGARNNEELKLWTYMLQKGKKYIFPEYMYVYRYSNSPEACNYNSTHGAIDAFQDFYQDICLLRSLFGGKYNYNPLFLRRANYVWNRYFSDNLIEMLRLFKCIKLLDVAKLVKYKIYLKFHNYVDPIKWDNPKYLISDR